MKIDFSQPLRTMDGEPIREQGYEAALQGFAHSLIKHEGAAPSTSGCCKILDDHDIKFSEILTKQGNVFTLKVCLISLLIGKRADDEKELDATTLTHRRWLADKIYGAAEPFEPKSADIVLLRELLARAYNKRIFTALIVGQALMYIEPEQGE